MNEKVLIVDDDPSTLDMLQIMLEAQGYIVANAFDGVNALEKIKQEDFDLVITDLKMPRLDGVGLLKEIKTYHPDLEVIMTTAYMSIETAISAMKIGAYDYLTKPIEDLERARIIIEKAVEKSRIKAENSHLRNQLHDLPSSFSGMIGKSKPMQRVYEIIEKVAKSDTSVLIQGESGTGKELVAWAIHNKSMRADKKMVPVDCGSLPRELLESELFGHARGAFTGAVAEKKGLFEQAHGGTLFLDEISSTDLHFQAKLLRSLQQKEIKRVGGNDCIKTDIRLISASNKDLKEQVRQNTFRQDLFYRINIVTIDLPALRERKDDIVLLCDYFLKKYNRNNMNKVERISDEVMHIFSQYLWPGNVRELENVIERAIILSNSDHIQKKDLPPELLDNNLACHISYANNMVFSQAKEIFEKNYLTQLLKESGGNISAAARKAGLLRQGLQSKIKKYNIDPALFK